MTFALILAVLLAGGSALFLGLVDAGQELDSSLSQLDYEASSLHRATIETVQLGASSERINRPRTSLKRMIDGFGATADRILGDTAPPYSRPLARALAAVVDLVPSSDGIGRALGDYLDQADQARAETAKAAGAGELMGRLLDLSYSRISQQISEARERTRHGVSRALVGVQMITLISIGIAALTLGLTARPE
jgi:hypothetical protein